ncbi:hypothetical protein HPB49_024064 [Dermacentor silvarum]|uniref:Uncharacterized protein n=1 Tax=Dermacentor silvarum TaxID=543639 RepID=A0ACB8CC06_DERSI|nr:hypothetical protein HPB49_024064 [Dermacentor silvarum]
MQEAIRTTELCHSPAGLKCSSRKSELIFYRPSKPGRKPKGWGRDNRRHIVLFDMNGTYTRSLTKGEASPARRLFLPRLLRIPQKLPSAIQASAFLSLGGDMLSRMEVVDRSDDDIRQEMEDDNGWKVFRYERRAKEGAKRAMPSTSPSRLPKDHADKYQSMKTIKFKGKEYEVAAYETAPDVTAKIVIRGVPVEVSPRDITAAIITPRNRTAIAAKRLGNTTTVIILFEGYKVRSYVNYGAVFPRCSLYRKQVEFCKQCNRLGHRSDVCPKPEDKLCAGCSKTNPDQDHTCQPRCQLCGMDHHTAVKTCKAKFKKPYIVKHRQWLRQEQAFKQQEEQQQQLRFADGPTERKRSRATPWDT